MNGGPPRAGPGHWPAAAALRAEDEWWEDFAPAIVPPPTRARALPATAMLRMVRVRFMVRSFGWLTSSIRPTRSGTLRRGVWESAGNRRRRACGRQTHHEARALARPAVHVDAAAMGGDHRRHDGQAQPAAAGVA